MGNDVCIFFIFYSDFYDPLWYENTSTPLNEACWKGLKDEVQWLIDKIGYQSRGMNGWSPALAASYDGHIDVLHLLINHCDPSQGDDDSVTSLHVASYKGHINIAQHLVNECHIDPDRADSSCNTPLLYSALGGQVDLVTFFLKKKCNVSQVNREGSSLSLLACKSGRVALVRQLKQFGLFSADDQDYHGRGIIHYCAMSDSVELLEYLQNNYVVIFNDKDRYGITPLHIASQYASLAIIMRMISVYGYKVLLDTDYYGHSSLHYLCSGLTESHCVTEVYNKLFVPYDTPRLQQIPTFDITESGKLNTLSKFITLNVNVSKQHDRVSLLSTLLKKTSSCHSFNINSITTTGQSLLHLACTSGSTLLVKVLEEYGINTSSLDYEGRSAVHYAALSGSPTLLSYTVSQFSLNASQPDYNGVVPLALACMSGSINAVEYLINTTDIDIDVTCDKTPLHYSCHHGNLGLSQYLIEVQGSDINMRDNDGWYALTYSARSGNMELVQYLIKKNPLLLTSFSLLQAVCSTKLPLIKILVNEYKLDPHVKSSDGMQAVHCAAQVGAIDVLEYLIKDCGCDLSTVGCEYNSNVFHYSAINGNYSLIKYIIDRYPQYTSLLHSTDDFYSLPIHRACVSGVIQLVTFLIDIMKCDVTTEDKFGYTCVMNACRSGNLDLVKLLIKTYKLNPRISAGKGTSPTAAVIYGNAHILEWLRQEYHINVAMFNNALLFFEAAQYNCLYCLKYLLNNDSFDINATDPSEDTQSTLLHLACQEGHVATVLYLTSLPKCDVSAKTSNGSTALHLACKSRSLPILKCLVEECHMDLIIRDYNGMAPVHVACEAGSLSLVKYIIDHSSLSLDITDSFGRTPLLIAAFSKNLPIIRYLNSKNCNISILDDKGFNVIHVSAQRGSLDILRFFIDGGYCNPDITDASNRTPLYLSAQEGHSEIVDYLLDSPSYQRPRVGLVDMPDSNGNTALHAACNRGHPIVSTITGAYKSLSIDIYTVNDNGQTPLHLAAANGHVNTVMSLLSATTGTPTHEKLLTAVDGNGCSSLHLSCENGHYRMALYLSEVYPGNVYSLNNKEEGLLHAAAQSGNEDLVQFLVESHGLDPESQDKDGVTCLHIIAKQGDTELYKYLVPHVKNNPTPRDKTGRSPLHYAGRHYKMSLYLIQSFDCHPEDKDRKGFTGLHAACRGGNIELVSHYLAVHKCDKYLLTNNSRGLLYFACRSGNLELVRVLMDDYDLEPVQGDIDGAKSVNAESIVKFLEFRITLSKLVREMINEAERRQLIPIATKPRPSFLSS